MKHEEEEGKNGRRAAGKRQRLVVASGTTKADVESPEKKEPAFLAHPWLIGRLSSRPCKAFAAKPGPAPAPTPHPLQDMWVAPQAVPPPYVGPRGHLESTKRRKAVAGLLTQNELTCLQRSR